MRATSFLTILALVATTFGAPTNPSGPVPLETLNEQQLDALADKAAKQLQNPVDCYSTQFSSGVRYNCNYNKPSPQSMAYAFNTLTTPQVQSLFDRITTRLPKGEPTAIQSYFFKPDKVPVENIHPNAPFYFYGYGKGCSWRNFATGSLKNNGVTLQDMMDRKVKFDQISPFNRQAMSDQCAWFAVEGPTKDAVAPMGAKLAMEF